VQVQHAEICATKTRCIFQYAPKHRRQFTGRGTDNLQHLRRRRLLLQRLGEVRGALAQLVEQPRVLDSDSRLIGEGCAPVDFAIGKRFNTPAAREADAPMGSPSRMSGTPIIERTALRRGLRAAVFV
jgi:hypothetical protein